MPTDAFLVAPACHIRSVVTAQPAAVQLVSDDEPGYVGQRISFVQREIDLSIATIRLMNSCRFHMP
jgi:hypothetical protein